MKDFGLKEIIGTGTYIKVTKLINEKYSNNLEKIYIINQNCYAEFAYNLLKSLLNDRLKNMVVFSNNVKLTHDNKC